MIKIGIVLIAAVTLITAVVIQEIGQIRITKMNIEAARPHAQMIQAVNSMHARITELEKKKRR